MKLLQQGRGDSALAKAHKEEVRSNQNKKLALLPGWGVQSSDAQKQAQ